MTVGGWVFLLSSVSFVVALCAWCYVKVFAAEPPADDPPSDPSRGSQSP